jgi:hypothetical protein
MKMLMLLSAKHRTLSRSRITSKMITNGRREKTQPRIRILKAGVPRVDHHQGALAVAAQALIDRRNNIEGVDAIRKNLEIPRGAHDLAIEKTKTNDLTTKSKPH